MVGLAIYKGMQIKPVISPLFLNKVLKIDNTSEDLRWLDEQLYEGLMRLKHSSFADSLGLDFTIA